VWKAHRVQDDLLAYYGLGAEPTRLDTGVGALEYERTREIVARFLLPESDVTDVGGGDGRYAAWLADLGHRVDLVEPVALHLQLARDRAGDPPRFNVHEGDARALPLPSDSADAVFLLGPLYHLGELSDRLQALGEATRVCRPGGLVFAAAISRFAPMLDTIRRGRVNDDALFANVLDETATGRRVAAARRTSPFPDSYFHLPEELEEEVAAAGLEVETVYGVEGPGSVLNDRDPAWADEAVRERLLVAARLVETDPHLMAVSAHLLAVARRPF
jgi:SAM-dependent methyltransferase